MEEHASRSNSALYEGLELPSAYRPLLVSRDDLSLVTLIETDHNKSVADEDDVRMLKYTGNDVMELLRSAYQQILTLEEWLYQVLDTSNEEMQMDTNTASCSYRSLLSTVYVGLSCDLMTGGFTLSQHSSLREVTLRAIERILKKKPLVQNILTLGYSLRSTDTGAQTGGGDVEITYPNSSFNTLQSKPWDDLLTKVGDSIFLWLLENTSLFLHIHSTCFVQLTGIPINTVLAEQPKAALREKYVNNAQKKYRIHQKPSHVKSRSKSKQRQQCRESLKVEKLKQSVKATTTSRTLKLSIGATTKTSVATNNTFPKEKHARKKRFENLDTSPHLIELRKQAMEFAQASGHRKPAEKLRHQDRHLYGNELNNKDMKIGLNTSSYDEVTTGDKKVLGQRKRKIEFEEMLDELMDNSERVLPAPKKSRLFYSQSELDASVECTVEKGASEVCTSVESIVKRNRTEAGTLVESTVKINRTEAGTSVESTVERSISEVGNLIKSEVNTYERGQAISGESAMSSCTQSDDIQIRTEVYKTESSEDKAIHDEKIHRKVKTVSKKSKENSLGGDENMSEEIIAQSHSNNIVNKTEENITKTLIDDIGNKPEENITESFSDNIIKETEENITESLSDDIIKETEENITESLTDDIIKETVENIAESLSDDILEEIVKENVTESHSDNLILRTDKNIIKSYNNDIEKKIEDIVAESQTNGAVKKTEEIRSQKNDEDTEIKANLPELEKAMVDAVNPDGQSRTEQVEDCHDHEYLNDTMRELGRKVQGFSKKQNRNRHHASFKPFDAGMTLPRHNYLYKKNTKEKMSKYSLLSNLQVNAESLLSLHKNIFVDTVVILKGERIHVEMPSMNTCITSLGHRLPLNAKCEKFDQDSVTNCSSNKCNENKGEENVVYSDSYQLEHSSFEHNSHFLNCNLSSSSSLLLSNSLPPVEVEAAADSTKTVAVAVTRSSSSSAAAVTTKTEAVTVTVQSSSRAVAVVATEAVAVPRSLSSSAAAISSSLLSSSQHLNKIAELHLNKTFTQEPVSRKQKRDQSSVDDMESTFTINRKPSSVDNTEFTNCSLDSSVTCIDNAKVRSVKGLDKEKLLKPRMSQFLGKSTEHSKSQPDCIELTEYRLCRNVAILDNRQSRSVQGLEKESEVGLASVSEASHKEMLLKQRHIQLLKKKAESHGKPMRKYPLMDKEQKSSHVTDSNKQSGSASFVLCKQVIGSVDGSWNHEVNKKLQLGDWRANTDPVSLEQTEMETDVTIVNPVSIEQTEMETDVTIVNPVSLEQTEMETDVTIVNPVSLEQTEMETDVTIVNPVSLEQSEMETDVAIVNPIGFKAKEDDIADSLGRTAKDLSFTNDGKEHNVDPETPDSEQFELDTEDNTVNPNDFRSEDIQYTKDRNPNSANSDKSLFDHTGNTITDSRVGNDEQFTATDSEEIAAPNSVNIADESAVVKPIISLDSIEIRQMFNDHSEGTNNGCIPDRKIVLSATNVKESSAADTIATDVEDLSAADMKVLSAVDSALPLQTDDCSGHTNDMLSSADGLRDCELQGVIKIPVLDEVLPLLADFVQNHRKCPYRILVQTFCPVKRSRRPNLIHRKKGLKNATPPTLPSLLNSHSGHRQVYLFLRRCILRTVPLSLLGSVGNRNNLLKNLKKLLSAGRYDKYSLGQFMSGMKTKCIPWLKRLPNNSMKLHLLAKVVYWLVTKYIFVVLRTYFYVTDTGILKYKLLYYRNVVWSQIHKHGVQDLVRRNVLKSISQEEADRLVLSEESLGVSVLRFLPKDKTLRPIINMGYSDRPSAEKAISINQQLMVLHSVLSYLKGRKPSLLGYGKLGTDDLYKAWSKFGEKWKTQGKPKLYFVKTDIRRCYDTMKQDKMYDIMKNVLQKETSEDELIVRKYTITRRDKNGYKTRFVRQVGTLSEFNSNFIAFAKNLAAQKGMENAIFMDKVVYQHENTETLLEKLWKHLFNNIVKAGEHYYHQQSGISQGSILSTLLCNFYYADMEQKFDGVREDDFLMRIVDDYMYVTPSEDRARKFLSQMLEGFPEYACCTNTEKVLTNISRSDVTSIALDWFPWCGMLFNTRTLEVAVDYSRFVGISIEDTMTFDLCSCQGTALQKKILFSAVQKCHPIYLDARINSRSQILHNCYLLCLMTSYKLHTYIRKLPHQQRAQTNVQFFMGVVQSLSSLVYWCYQKAQVGIKEPGESLDISKDCINWICYSAFYKRLSMLSSQYSVMLKAIKHRLYILGKKLGKEAIEDLGSVLGKGLPEDFQLML